MLPFFLKIINPKPRKFSRFHFTVTDKANCLVDIIQPQSSELLKIKFSIDAWKGRESFKAHCPGDSFEIYLSDIYQHFLKYYQKSQTPKKYPKNCICFFRNIPDYIYLPLLNRLREAVEARFGPTELVVRNSYQPLLYDKVFIPHLLDLQELVYVENFAELDVKRLIMGEEEYLYGSSIDLRQAKKPILTTLTHLPIPRYGYPVSGFATEELEIQPFRKEQKAGDEIAIFASPGILNESNLLFDIERVARDLDLKVHQFDLNTAPKQEHLAIYYDPGNTVSRYIEGAKIVIRERSLPGIAVEGDTIFCHVESICEAITTFCKINNYRKKQSPASAEKEKDVIKTSKSLSSRIEMSSSNPQFSVLLPCYNHADFVGEAIASLKAQTYDHFEVLVVNDGSTDKSEQAILDAISDDKRFRYLKKLNGGVASALNLGLNHAKGDYINWLSSDDLFEPQALEIFAKHLERNQEDHFLHANFFQLIHETNTKKQISPTRRDYLPSKTLQMLRLLSANYINGITTCIRRALFKEVGEFNPCYRNAQDYDMWLRIMNFCPLTYVEGYVATTRYHAEAETQSFNAAGLYDSAASAMEYLNRHTFSSLVKGFSTNQVADIVVEAINVIVDGNSILYQGTGVTPQLFNLFVNWVIKLEDNQYHLAHNTLKSLVRNYPDIKILADITLLVARKQEQTHIKGNPIRLMMNHLIDEQIEQETKKNLAKYLKRRVDASPFHVVPS